MASASINAHHSNLLARIAVQRVQLGETAEETWHERAASIAVWRQSARAAQPGIDL